MSSPREQRMRRAEKLFADFTGRDPEALDMIEVQTHDVMIAAGRVTSIEYISARDGKLYRHDFKKNSRPVLAASDDGAQLYLLAGAYRFTDRGIVDS
jgi:hypothetical protein